MVACVSDEYAKSKNCVMELRFATVSLKIPVIGAVVGTGFKWEATEVKTSRTIMSVLPKKVSHERFRRRVLAFCRLSNVTQSVNCRWACCVSELQRLIFNMKVHRPSIDWLIWLENIYQKSKKMRAKKKTKGKKQNRATTPSR